MSHRSLKCIVCQFVAVTIAELHRHQSSTHSTEQLSRSIIEFQNFVNSNKENFDSSSQYNVLHRDSPDVPNKDVQLRRKFEDEQNEPLCLKKSKTEVFAMQDEMNIKQEVEESTNLFADIRMQEMFISWEMELNKPLEISEDDFCRTIEVLCKDLNNPNCRAPKRFRKPKPVITTKRKYIKHERKKKSHHSKSVSDGQMNDTFYPPDDIKEEPISYNDDYIHNSNGDIKDMQNSMSYSNDMYQKSVVSEMTHFYNDNLQDDSYLYVNNINSLFDNISDDFAMNTTVAQTFSNAENSNPSIIMSNDNQVSLLKL